MELTTLGLILATAIFIAYYVRSRQKGRLQNRYKHIPGPKGLPFLGNLLQIGSFPNDQYCEWSKEFGKIFQIKLVSHKIIIVSDPKLTKEIFSEYAFTGRVHITVFDMFPETPGLGMFSSDGPHWEVHRRFLLRHLRDFGFGKSVMEQLIMDEVVQVIQEYKENKGKPISKVHQNLRLLLVNALWSILTSKKLSRDDPKLIKLTNNTTEQFNDLFEKGSALIFLPWLRHIIPKAIGYTDFRAMLNENRKIFLDEVEEHKRNFKEENLKDFIDVYLAEVRKTTDPKSPFYGQRAEWNLAYTLFDLFNAGTESTAVTISWSILYLCKFPYAQKNLQKEIEEIVGNSRHVSVSDRPNMSYAMALMDEILRFSSIAMDGIPHRAMQHTEFQGYFIEKDTWIQPNAYYIHMDPKIWGDPEKFRPERFLSEDGKKYVKNENMQAFQAGRRACAGEALARDTMFLYVTNLFQKFNMELDPNEKDPGLKCGKGFLRNPPPYSVLMKERVS